MESIDVIKKIKDIRVAKKKSIEDIALSLAISANAYRKIEMNYTKLTIDRLYEISKILEVEISELLGIETKEVYNQENKDNATGYLQKIEHFYQDNKEITQKLIETQQSEIQFLRELLAKSGGK